MKPSFVIPIIQELAAELGIVFEVEERYGHAGRLILSDGSTRYISGSLFDLNDAGATAVAKDKDYASYFLAKSGFPVPVGEAFHTKEWAKYIQSDRAVDAAWEYVQTIGLPVIVKPNSKSQGDGVSLARTKSDFIQAVNRASKNERVFLVQKPIIGKDYRIVVLDGEVISAYERIPLFIIGDGTRTITELIDAKQHEFNRMNRNTIIDINDPRILVTLRQKKLAFSSIIDAGVILTLLPNANLSTGGDAKDVTESIHPDWKMLTTKIAQATNLRFIGIDIMTNTDLSDAPKDYPVLEINASPGLDNYASIGEKQHAVVKELYRKVLMAMMC